MYTGTYFFTKYNIVHSVKFVHISTILKLTVVPKINNKSYNLRGSFLIGCRVYNFYM